MTAWSWKSLEDIPLSSSPSGDMGGTGKFAEVSDILRKGNLASVNLNS